MPRSFPTLFLPLLLLGGVLVACSSAPDKRQLQYLNRYGLGKKYWGNAEEENYATIGDTVVYFDQLHEEELAGSQEVDIDGTILLPEVGTVHVAGYTRSDIEAVLKERYSVYYDETDIVVDIRTKGKQYFIYGEVGREGPKKHEGDVTIWQAVMEASPDDNSANLGRVRLIRADPVDPLIFVVNINDVIENGDSTFNIQVQENDIIYVPPTLLAELAYFIDDLLFPVKEVLRGLGGALFGFGPRTNQNNRRRNNNYGGGSYWF